MSKSNVNQASGAAVKRSCDSGTAIMLDKTGNTNVNRAPGAGAKRRRVIGQSEYPDFVFTKLSDAIREWQETGTSKALHLPFNIIATVQKWSQPKQSKGVNSSNIFAQETNMWLQDQIYKSRQRCGRMSKIAGLTLLFSLTAANTRNQFQLEKKFV